MDTIPASASPRVGGRTRTMTPIGVERMGDAADALSDPAMLRLENLDTDLAPPIIALERTLAQVRADDANSYLPFFGHDALRRAAAGLVARNAGLPATTYDWRTQCFVSAGGLGGILNALLAVIEPGDEVVMTSPTYVGLVNRVKLAGGVPRFARLVPSAEGWRLDLASLDAAVTPRTRAFLMMSPSMPSGAVLSRAEWAAVCAACIAADAWMIHDAAMERLLFDGVEHVGPLRFDGMRERTITVGSASKEYRMIGWRVGWVVTPLAAAEAIGRVAISNVVCPVGIAQQAVAEAIGSSDDGIANALPRIMRKSAAAIVIHAALRTCSGARPGSARAITSSRSSSGAGRIAARRANSSRSKVSSSNRIYFSPSRYASSVVRKTSRARWISTFTFASALPILYSCMCIFPSLCTMTFVWSESAFTTDAPTPWSPPETLYPESSPPNFPPAWSVVMIISSAETFVFGWMSTGMPRPLSATRI